MPRAKTKPADAPVANDRLSRDHAKQALAWFQAAKKIALKRVGDEQATKRKAIDALRRRYDDLCAAYLRVAGTTYAMWCEIVKPEWDELVAAAGDDAIWDRLVDTYQERNHV